MSTTVFLLTSICIGNPKNSVVDVRRVKLLARNVMRNLFDIIGAFSYCNGLSLSGINYGTFLICSVRERAINAG